MKDDDPLFDWKEPGERWFDSPRWTEPPEQMDTTVRQLLTSEHPYSLEDARHQITTDSVAKSLRAISWWVGEHIRRKHSELQWTWVKKHNYWLPLLRHNKRTVSPVAIVDDWWTKAEHSLESAIEWAIKRRPELPFTVLPADPIDYGPRGPGPNKPKDE